MFDIFGIKRLVRTIYEEIQQIQVDLRALGEILRVYVNFRTVPQSIGILETKVFFEVDQGKGKEIHCLRDQVNYAKNSIEEIQIEFSPRFFIGIKEGAEIILRVYLETKVDRGAQ